MSKVQVVKQQQEKNVVTERDLLYECASTFVLKLYMTYQSADEIFLLMELIQGGELWQYIYEKKHLLSRTSLGGLSTEAVQFYTAHRQCLRFTSTCITLFLILTLGLRNICIAIRA